VRRCARDRRGSAAAARQAAGPSDSPAQRPPKACAALRAAGPGQRPERQPNAPGRRPERQPKACAALRAGAPAKGVCGAARGTGAAARRAGGPSASQRRVRRCVRDRRGCAPGRRPERQPKACAALRAGPARLRASPYKLQRRRLVLGSEASR